jgi:hypothetical protein
MNNKKHIKNKVSLILLNWKRTEELKSIVKKYSGYDLVGEILVWNNNPEIHLTIDSEKTRIINTSEDFGLFTRFAAAALAKYPCILYHDDDIIAPEETLNTLYEKWKLSPFNCHSATYGRNPKNGEYSLNSHYGNVEIMLTRYTMTHRKLCVHALSKIPEFYDIPGKPFGNGEDIILSYAAMEFSGKLNRAYPLKTENLAEDDENAINKRYPEHQKHRTQVIHRSKKVFNYSKRLDLLSRMAQFREALNIKFRQIREKSSAK